MTSLTPLVPVLLGGILTLAGTFGAKRWDEWRQAKATRWAIAAEIRSIIDISIERGHLKIFEELTEIWRQGMNPDVHKPYGIDRAFETNAVYQCSLDKIGMIGPELASEVISFYTHLLAVRISLEAYSKGVWDEYDPRVKAKQADEAIQIWKKAVSRAEKKLLPKLIR